jgi:hypothetical protein
MDIIHAHPFALVFSWWVFSAATGSLPAPTAQSSPFYQWSFKFLNTIAANIARAYNTSIENSPNFLPAVDLHLSKQAAGNSAERKT